MYNINKGINLSIFTGLLIAIVTQQPLLAEQQNYNTSPKFAIATVATNSSSGLSFSPSSSFSWLFKDVDIKQDAPISGQHIKEILNEEISSEMLSKGITIASSGSPSDYYIAFTVATESTLDDDTLLKRYKISPGFNAPKTGNNIYEKGTLLIHIINAGTRQTIWQSVVQANIKEDLGDDVRRARIKSIVKTMLRKLPVVQ